MKKRIVPSHCAKALANASEHILNPVDTVTDPDRVQSRVE